MTNKRTERAGGRATFLALVLCFVLWFVKFAFYLPGGGVDEREKARGWPFVFKNFLSKFFPLQYSGIKNIGGWQNFLVGKISKLFAQHG